MLKLFVLAVTSLVVLTPQKFSIEAFEFDTEIVFENDFEKEFQNYFISDSSILTNANIDDDTEWDPPLVKLLSGNGDNELSQIMHQAANANIQDVPGKWSSLMDNPTTTGQAGRGQIVNAGDRESAQQVVHQMGYEVDPDCGDHEVLENLVAMSYVDTSVYQSKVISLVSGESGKLSVIILAARKLPDSEVREVGWAKFNSKASLKKQYETYYKIEKVRCSNPLNGWGKNCTKKTKKEEERGLKTDEIDVIQRKLNQAGFEWLKGNFPVSFAFSAVADSSFNIEYDTKTVDLLDVIEYDYNYDDDDEWDPPLLRSGSIDLKTELGKLMNDIADSEINDNLSADGPGNELMEEPSTTGETGMTEITAGNKEQVDVITNQLVVDGSNDELKQEVRETVEMLTFTESSVFISKVFSIVSGDTGRQSVVILAGRRPNEDSEEREVVWTKFTTEAQLKQQYEEYTEKKRVRCKNPLNGWGKNCSENVTKTRERGIRTEEIDTIIRKLTLHGYRWLKSQFVVGVNSVSKNLRH